jgi:hypothetical protein
MKQAAGRPGWALSDRRRPPVPEAPLEDCQLQAGDACPATTRRIRAVSESMSTRFRRVDLGETVRPGAGDGGPGSTGMARQAKVGARAVGSSRVLG